MSTFGERLRQYRAETNVTLEELAARLGTNKQVLSRYENELRVPKITALQGYARALNLNPLWLMGFDDVSQKPDTQSDTIDITEFSPTKRAIIRSVTTLSDEDAKAIAQLLGRIRSDENGRGGL